MLDERGDGGIAEHRRAEIVKSESAARKRANEPERRRRAQQTQRGLRRKAKRRRQGLGRARPRGQPLEQFEPHAGEQNLGVDEARAEIEQVARATTGDPPGQGRLRRPALKAGVGDQPVAQAQPTFAPGGRPRLARCAEGVHAGRRSGRDASELLGEEHRGLGLDERPQFDRSRAGRDRLDRGLDKAFQAVLGAADAQLRGRVGP